MEQITVEIINKKGLHARAAARFVKVVAAYSAIVTVVKAGHAGRPDSQEVQGGSILGLMMLGADPGSILHISATGEQSAAALAALKELVESRFGETE